MAVFAQGAVARQPPIAIGVRILLRGPRPTSTSQRDCLYFGGMDTKSQQPKGRDSILSSLNVAIEAVNLAKEISSVTPAKAVFGSVGVLLTMIKVRFLPCGETF